MNLKYFINLYLSVCNNTGSTEKYRVNTLVSTSSGREISHAKFIIPQLRISFKLNLFEKAYTE